MSPTHTEYNSPSLRTTAAAYNRQLKWGHCSEVEPVPICQPNEGEETPAPYPGSFASQEDQEAFEFMNGSMGYNCRLKNSTET